MFEQDSIHLVLGFNRTVYTWFMIEQDSIRMVQD